MSFKCSKSIILKGLLFLIYPILLLPSILLDIGKKKEYAIVLFSIFLGLTAYLYPPTGDLYRGAMDFYNYINLSWTQMVQNLQEEFDFLYPVLSWFLAQLSLSPDFLRFLYVSIGVYFIFLIFADIANEQNWKQKKVILLFVIVFLMVRYTYFMYRFGFSLALFTYGVYLFSFKNNYLKAILLFIISALNHFSFIIFVALFIFVYCIKFKGNKPLSLIFFITSFILSGDLVSVIIKSLPIGQEVINHLLMYTEGYYGGEYLENHSSNYILLSKLLQCNYVVLYYQYYSMFKTNMFSGWITGLLVINFLVSPFPSVSGRIQVILVLSLLIYVAKHFNYDLCLKKTCRQLKLLLYTGIFYTLICTWSIRRELSISNEYKIILPTPFIISSSYDYEWMHQNINSDGSPITR